MKLKQTVLYEGLKPPTYGQIVEYLKATGWQSEGRTFTRAFGDAEESVFMPYMSQVLSWESAASDLLERIARAEQVPVIEVYLNVIRGRSEMLPEERAVALLNAAIQAIVQGAEVVTSQEKLAIDTLGAVRAWAADRADIGREFQIPSLTWYNLD